MNAEPHENDSLKIIKADVYDNLYNHKGKRIKITWRNKQRENSLGHGGGCHHFQDARRRVARLIMELGGALQLLCLKPHRCPPYGIFHPAHVVLLWAEAVQTAWRGTEPRVSRQDEPMWQFLCAITLLQFLRCKRIAFVIEETQDQIRKKSLLTN